MANYDATLNAKAHTLEIRPHEGMVTPEQAKELDVKVVEAVRTALLNGYQLTIVDSLKPGEVNLITAKTVKNPNEPNNMARNIVEMIARRNPSDSRINELASSIINYTPFSKLPPEVLRNLQSFFPNPFRVDKLTRASADDELISRVLKAKALGYKDDQTAEKDKPAEAAAFIKMMAKFNGDREECVKLANGFLKIDARLFSGDPEVDRPLLILISSPKTYLTRFSDHEFSPRWLQKKTPAQLRDFLASIPGKDWIQLERELVVFSSNNATLFPFSIAAVLIAAQNIHDEADQQKWIKLAYHVIQEPMVSFGRSIAGFEPPYLTTDELRRTAEASGKTSDEIKQIEDEYFGMLLPDFDVGQLEQLPPITVKDFFSDLKTIFSLPPTTTLEEFIELSSTR